MEQFGWFDPDAPPMAPEHDAEGLTLDEVAGDLWQDYGDVDGCAICTEIVEREADRTFPGWACERRGCLRCEVCSRCQDTGQVCRNCERCLDCAEDDGPCGIARWNRVLRREVWFAVHETYDVVTGRWSA